MSYRRKKILFLLPSLYGGGSERVLLTIIKYLDRDKFEPILVLLDSIDDIPNSILENSKIINLNSSKLRYASFKIFRTIKIEKPDIVFSTLGHVNLFIALTRVLFSKKTLFVARESNTISSMNKTEKYPKLFDWLFKKVYNNLDLIINQSLYMRNDLVKNYNIKEDKIRVIKNPIDIRNIDNLLKDSNKNLFDNTKINLLSVGRLEYQKGYEFLIEALTKLDDRFYLTIIGDGSYENILKELIIKNSLQNRVNLLGFKSNPYIYMKSADILVLSSRFEGLPNVVLEANYCQTPAVVFNSPGGSSEIIIDGFNGFLAKAFDVDDLALKIEMASQHSFDKDDIKNRTKKRYSVEKIVKEYEDTILEFYKLSPL